MIDTLYTLATVAVVALLLVAVGVLVAAYLDLRHDQRRFLGHRSFRPPRRPRR